VQGFWLGSLAAVACRCAGAARALPRVAAPDRTAATIALVVIAVWQPFPRAFTRVQVSSNHRRHCAQQCPDGRDRHRGWPMPPTRLRRGVEENVGSRIIVVDPTAQYVASIRTGRAFGRRTGHRSTRTLADRDANWLPRSDPRHGRVCSFVSCALAQFCYGSREARDVGAVRSRAAVYCTPAKSCACAMCAEARCAA